MVLLSIQDDMLNEIAALIILGNISLQEQCY